MSNKIYYLKLRNYLSYKDGLSLQELLVQKKLNKNLLLLLQHKPVYTLGRRSVEENPTESSHLRNLGADYFLTKRGGQITYHGPGQLVGYPIFNLSNLNLSVKCYVDRLEKSIIKMLDDHYNIKGMTSQHTGVWLNDIEKIASIGIQVRHRYTSHGFAINVSNEPLDWFKHIVACGIQGAQMTSISKALNKDINVEDSTIPCVNAFSKIFNAQLEELTGDDQIDELLQSTVYKQ